MIRLLFIRVAWRLLAPFAVLLGFFGVCWLIDLLDRMGVLEG